MNNAEMTELVSKLIGEKLKYLREKEGLTQQEAAEKIGISHTYYATLERGEKWPSLETLEKVKTAYNIDNETLCGSDSSQAVEQLSTVIKHQEDTINTLQATIRALQRSVPKAPLTELFAAASLLSEKSQSALMDFATRLVEIERDSRAAQKKAAD